MQPDHGGRLELRLERADDSTAHYHVLLSAPDAEWQSVATIRIADGNVQFTSWSAAPPSWLEDMARALLRTLWRANKTGAAWPRRITRWRNEPSGSTEGSR